MKCKCGNPLLKNTKFCESSDCRKNSIDRRCSVANCSYDRHNGYSICKHHEERYVNAPGDFETFCTKYLNV